jgi:dihydrofolate synthase/folylpolyglutamate synthase
VAHGILAALPEPYRPTGDQIDQAFGSARVAGRLDRRGRWLFDVAHNPDGMRALVSALKVMRPQRPLHALVSILGDKEWPEMLVQLDQAVDRGVLTIAPTAAARGWDIEWLGRWLRDPSRPPPHAVWTLVPDFKEAIEKVQEGAGTMLVTGSFHTVGDVMSELGMEV